MTGPGASESGLSVSLQLPHGDELELECPQNGALADLVIPTWHTGLHRAEAEHAKTDTEATCLILDRIRYWILRSVKVCVDRPAT